MQTLKSNKIPDINSYKLLLMKNFRCFILALFSAFSVSCSQETKVEHPEAGNGAVSFSSATMEASLTSSMYRIKVQTDEQYENAAFVKIEMTDIILTPVEGEVIQVSDPLTDLNFILTTDELYIPAYNRDADGMGVPEKSFEIHIPNFKNYKSVSFKARLIGNTGRISEMSALFSKPTGIAIAGTYEIDPTFDLGGQTIDPYTFTVEIDESDPSKVWFSNLETLESEIGSRTLYGILDEATFSVTIPAEQEFALDPMQGGTIILGIATPDGGLTMGSPVLKFSESGIEFTNGLFFGELMPNNSVSGWTFIAYGDQASRI